MVEKAKIFYFAVFILVVFAFIFHVTAMGHHHWKKADLRDMNTINPLAFNYTTIGLFTRCIISPTLKQETCFPNMFPGNNSCNPQTSCLARESNPLCSCDFLPSTKGIAACTIIASIFLGLTIIILFIHSINATETRSLGMILSLLPLILLLLAFIFILIALILVGSYLSRDVMYLLHQPSTEFNLDTLRNEARTIFKVRVDWSTGLEIISLFFTFLSLILYSAFVFKFGRSS
ncbi:unnamed protein product [Rotaria socialis]|uniref:Uncharacterized protein n=1 Tax=Rotaria socialis TaxID=392032 RepID=A0A817W1H2_9BILA|nr:unnamed protein product [Rotaria socialis]CAF3335819.1 unnamed protein product [Rotaria socialis]CAF3346793.1 unnamed protein product [Rotaria socialis]CAF3388693.1 unnamed protein product [Rotaria socialis]CAF3758077.1 unnamed protein product [Rotaria socialis]